MPNNDATVPTPPADDRLASFAGLTQALQAGEPAATINAVERVLRGISNCCDGVWESVDETEWMDAEQAHEEWTGVIVALVDYAARVGFDLTSPGKLPGEELAMLMGLKPLYKDTRGMLAGSHRLQNDDEWKRLAAIAVSDLEAFRLGLKLPGMPRGAGAGANPTAQNTPAGTGPDPDEQAPPAGPPGK